MYHTGLQFSLQYGENLWQDINVMTEGTFKEKNPWLATGSFVKHSTQCLALVKMFFTCKISISIAIMIDPSIVKWNA